MTSRLKYPPPLAVPDDLGLNQIKAKIEQRQAALADQFLRVVLEFINGIEMGPSHYSDIDDALEVFNDPHLSYSYLIWRSPTRGTVHVMAYRFTTGFVANDAAKSMTYESSFESGTISDDKWPESLRAHIEAGRTG